MRKISILAFCLPLFAILVYYTLFEWVDEISSNQKVARATAQDNTAPSFPNAVSPSSSDEIAEGLKESRRALADSASYELQRSIDEGIFETRIPEYKALFARWKLSEASSQHALEIIQECYVKRGEAFVDYLKGHDKPGNLEALQVADRAEMELMRAQLEKSLGENRYQELAELEAKMERELAMRVSNRTED